MLARINIRMTWKFSDRLKWTLKHWIKTSIEWEVSHPSSIGHELTCKVSKKRTITKGSTNTIRNACKHRMAMIWWLHQGALAVWVVGAQRIGVIQEDQSLNRLNQRKISIVSVLKALSQLDRKVNKWALQIWTFRTRTVFKGNTGTNLTSIIRTHSNPWMSLMQEDPDTQAMVKVREVIQIRTKTNTGNNNKDLRKIRTSVLGNRLVQATEGVKGMLHQIEECHYKKWITTCMHNKLTDQDMEMMKWWHLQLSVSRQQLYKALEMNNKRPMTIFSTYSKANLNLRKRLRKQRFNWVSKPTSILLTLSEYSMNLEMVLPLFRICRKVCVILGSK